ncbi:hypothetical protein ATANTOWER_010381 [Ataeniobius toweri]|uniref:VWFC domain-containing protein n=1 Tax=Ataeniobius toweri TaxID=208326 RepID=A0ABU7AF59_9TELE|nr:hypothetical protein [Ataeniobius toweri]
MTDRMQSKQSQKPLPAVSQCFTVFPSDSLPVAASSCSRPEGKQAQCVYRGLTMFDLAVWSPSPCVTCLCSEGRVVCDEMSCPRMHCPSPATPAGQCCPVCMEPVSFLSSPLLSSSSPFVFHFSVLSFLPSDWLPRGTVQPPLLRLRAQPRTFW